MINFVSLLCHRLDLFHHNVDRRLYSVAGQLDQKNLSLDLWLGILIVPIFQTTKLCNWFFINSSFKLFSPKTTGWLSLGRLSIESFLLEYDCSVDKPSLPLFVLEYKYSGTAQWVFVFDWRPYSSSCFFINRSWFLTQGFNRRIHLCRRFHREMGSFDHCVRLLMVRIFQIVQWVLVHLPDQYSFLSVTIDVISSIKVSIEGYVVVEDDSTKKSSLWILGSEFWLSQTSKKCSWYCIFPGFKLFFSKTTGLLSLSKLSIDFFTWGVFHWEAVFVSLRWNAISLKLLVFVFDLRRYLYWYFSLRRNLIS